MQRLAIKLRPDLALQIQRAFLAIGDQLTDAQLRAFVRELSGDFSSSAQLGSFRTALNEALDGSFAQVEAQIFRTVSENVAFFSKELPMLGKRGGVVVSQFNILDPEVVPAIRALNTKVIETLKGDVRETLRAFVENGLRDGKPPATIARQVRSTIGLAPNQVDAVANFERMLRDGDLTALNRKLRDKRFDRTLRKALGKGGTGLTDAQIERMTAAYRKRFVAFNADTNARTATLDALKLAKHESTKGAIKAGLLDPARMRSRWVNSGDGKVRDLHVEVNGEVVPFGQPFSTGEVIPGSSVFNCRCIKVDFQARNTPAQQIQARIA